jgi:hypothetical protein
VDGGLANGAGLAGGGRIGCAAGEVDGGARLAACRWLRPGPVGRPANNKRGGGMLVRQVTCGDLRNVATKCVSRCLTKWLRTATGDAEVSESARGEQIGEPDVSGNVDPHCRLKARNAFAEVRAPGGVSPPPVSGKGKLVNISKDQIVQLLESQGNHDRAQQASQQLPDQVDTDNVQHADLLSKLGLDPGSLGGQLGGLGKIL